MGNTDLWKQVEKTDPSAVKEITGKPYKGNSPKPHWLFYRATEVFGPCGIGWGVEIVDERVEDGAPGDKVHIARVRVWYLHGEKRGAVEHVGQTMFCGKRNNGNPYTDEDAPKKSVTDATVKALSMIGFAGDIFSGRWDDSKYVAETREEFEAQRRQEEQPSLAAYMDTALRAIDAMKTRDDLVAWWNDETKAREFVGIKPNSTDYAKLRAAWTKKGQAFSHAKIIDSRDRRPAA